MIVMIDNHDSFTYNLIDYLTVQTTDDVQVISVDQVTIPMLKQLDPQAIVISPGLVVQVIILYLQPYSRNIIERCLY